MFIGKLFKIYRGMADTVRSAPRTGGKVMISGPSGTDLSVATVFRCVKILGDAVAGIRLRHLIQKEGYYQELLGDPIQYLLSVQPQPEMSAFTFWSSLVQRMLLDGDAYVYPRYVRGTLTDLVLCPRYSVDHDIRNSAYTINDPIGGVYGTFPSESVIHVFLYTSDGYQGESVLSHARRAIDIAKVGDQETLERFENGGSVHGMITNEQGGVRGLGEYQDKQLSALAESVDRSIRSGNRIFSIPGRASFQQLSMSSADMQFLESRKFSVVDICRFFGVHPSFVFGESGGNYKSVESAGQAFLTNTIDPILKRIEAEFNRKLIPREMFGRRTFLFDRGDIMSLDLPTLADYQLKTIQAGIYTPNEWRRKEGRAAIEGGDALFISANLRRIDENIELQDTKKYGKEK